MSKTLAIVLVLGIAPLVAGAAPVVSLDLQYQTTFLSEDVALAGSPSIDIGYDKSGVFGTGVGWDPDWVSRFAVYVSVSGMASGEDLGKVVIGCYMGPGASVSPGFDARGMNFISAPSPTRSYIGTSYTWYSYNDNGSVNDLRDLEYTFGAKEDWVFASKTTPNLSPEIAPVLLGWLFVRWDGRYLDLDNPNGGFGVFGDGDPSWSYYTGNSTGGSSSLVDVSGRYGDYIGMPEPATMTLLVLGGIGILRRRGTQRR